MATYTYNTDDTYVPPAGVRSLIVECWGGGGHGSGTQNGTISGFAGGGGGAYCKSRVSVTPGSSYAIDVGGQSQVSSFNGSTVVADFGLSTALENDNVAGIGGLVANCTYNLVAYAGGTGGIHTGSPGDAGAGGGEGAGTTADGNDGQDAVTATAGLGGTGGDGGDGGNGTKNVNGNPGVVPGGGGSGTGRGNGGGKVGGAGAAGQVRITELFSSPLPTFFLP